MVAFTENDDTLAWLNALSPVILAVAAILSALAFWIKSTATARAAQRANEIAIANGERIRRNSQQAEENAAAAAQIAAVHEEKLNEIHETVNSQRDAMLAEIHRLTETLAKYRQGLPVAELIAEIARLKAVIAAKIIRPPAEK